MLPHIHIQRINNDIYQNCRSFVGSMTTLVDTARRFSRPSVACDKRDLDKLHRACEVLRAGLRLRAARLIRESHDRTLLVQYGSDCTPLLTKERFAEAVGELDVVRAGKACNEFLIQRLFVEAGDKRCAVVEVPLPMASKSAFAHFAAARQLFKLPREMGHRGLCVVFHKFDRAVQQPMARLFRKFTAAWEDRFSQENDAGLSYRLYLTNWYLSTGCFAHDCHGGLKWSILNFSSDKECMRSCFLVHESLRHSYSILVKHLPCWIRSVLCFQDWNLRESQLLYQLLEVDDEWARTFSDLEIRFVDGKLCVAERHRTRADLLDVIIVCILKAWRFRQFSEGRFVTVGRCSRQLILSMLFGLEHYVGYVLKQGESQYYLGGVSRNLVPKVKCMTAMLALASKPSDNVLHAIMTDDRVPKMLPELDASMVRDLEALTSIPDSVWSVVSGTIGAEGPSFRSQCIIAAVTSVGFIQGHLREARRGAWGLLQGLMITNKS